MARVDVRGEIISNDRKWLYEWLEMDGTCPRDIQKVINELKPNEDLDVYINSPGGSVPMGSDIYTMLRETRNDHAVNVHITGQACSAASIIAMAGSYCEMSNTALMMVHCVSTSGYMGGNHTDFQKIVGMLETADRALCSAYSEKTGMTEEEALAMMEATTWLTAPEAKEKGLIDGIMFEAKEDTMNLTNSIGLNGPSDAALEKLKAMLIKPEIAPVQETNNNTILQAQLRLLEMTKIGGEVQ